MDFIWYLWQNQSMDLLADILQSSGLKKRILHQRALYQPWALRFPCPFSMGFHVVTSGQAYLWQAGEEQPIRLNKGDIAFMARGTEHLITTHPDPALIQSASSACHLPPSLPLSISQPALLALVSGAYQLWYEPIHPLFQALPEWTIIRAESIAYSDSVQSCLQVLAAEIEKPALGSEAIVAGMLDVLFHLILRRILQTQGLQTQTWMQAVQDPQLALALQAMHAQPENPWTLEALAEVAGLSRSGFALKFKQTLGDTPLHYLTTLRILKAMGLLTQTRENLEQVAAAVGYGDAFGFSKTFKKIVGLSPSAFRQKNASEQALAWRFA